VVLASRQQSGMHADGDWDGTGDGGRLADTVDAADAAVTALFDAHYTRMLRVAAVMLDDVTAAEDVVQEAFLAVHQSWERIRDRAQAAGYLHRSVVNGARSRLRRRGVVRRLHLAGLLGATGPGAVDSAETTALAGVTSGPLVAALRALPRREREVVLFRHYLDLSEQQTATALGLRPGSVKAYGSRGLATLRATLGDLLEYRESGR
jgi:RNA polymerase sigma-70 factor (sigma-E family)